MRDTLDLLLDLDARGIRLDLAGDRLKIVAPAGALAPELRALLAAHRDALAAVVGTCRRLDGLWARLRQLLVAAAASRLYAADAYAEEQEAEAETLRWGPIHEAETELAGLLEAPLPVPTSAAA